MTLGSIERALVLRLGGLSLLVAIYAGACDGGGGGGTDSNTNWVAPCQSSDDCGGLECLCAECTTACQSDKDCAALPGATCRSNRGREHECGDTSGTCEKTCLADHDCGKTGDLICSDGYCAARARDAGAGAAPDASERGGRDAGRTGTGGRNGTGGVSGTGGDGGGTRTPDAGVAPDAQGSSGPPSHDRGSDASSEASTDAGDLLDAGPEASPPFLGPNPLEFSFPTRHSMTDADGIRVAGTVAAGADIVSVTVNSVPAASLQGTFARWRTTDDVPLHDGTNEITIVAQQRRGPSLSLTGNVWKMPSNPLTAFGSGPNATQFRDNPFSTYATPKGRVFENAYDSELYTVDPDTGIRSNASLPALSNYYFSSEAWDPETGGLFISAAEGVYLANLDDGSSRRIGDSMGEDALAYDPSSHTLYGLGESGSSAMDTVTGSIRTFATSADLAKVLACGPLTQRVTPDGKYIRIASDDTVPGAIGNGSLCGCFEYEIATGNVATLEGTPGVPYGYCYAIDTPDGRLLHLNHDELDVLDPVTRAPTPFSQAPNRGRGFPLPDLSPDRGGNWSLAPDPRRDRWWLTLIPMEDEPGPTYYFVIDPFNGDRALVSE